MKSTLCRTYFKCIRRDLDSTFALGLRDAKNSHILISEIILKSCGKKLSLRSTLGLLNKSVQDLILIFTHQYKELKELYCLIVCLHSHVRAERIFGSSTTAFPGLFPLKFKGKTLGTRLGAQKLRIFTASELLRFCVRLNCCVNILKGINENGDYASSCSTTKCTFGVLHKIVLPKKE